jgi:hypothetical protein
MPDLRDTEGEIGILSGGRARADHRRGVEEVTGV